MKAISYLSVFVIIFTHFSFGQNIIITEKPLMIEDTVLTNIVNIAEIDVTKQYAYGVMKIEDASFFDLFGEINGNSLFLHHKKYEGVKKDAAKKTGAIGWSCWYGALNQNMVKATLELKTKNEVSPGEVNLFAVNYNPDGKGPTYIYFDLLPNINEFSSFPDFGENPYFKSSVGAVNEMAKSDKPKEANTTLTIEYTNSNGEKKKVSQALKFKNMQEGYLFDVRYPSVNHRKQKHYIHSEIQDSYLQNNFDEQKAVLSKKEAIELFENSQSGVKVKYINYAQSFTTKSKTDGSIQSMASRCTVVYTENNKCMFGEIYFRKISNGNGTFGAPEIERFELEGEVNCSIIK